MAGGLNRVTLIGNIGRDPEIRSTKAGVKVANFTVATSERWNDANGAPQERTEWHRVSVLSDKLAEVAEKYLRKGSKVYVEGSLQTRKWTDKDGHERYTTEVVLRRFDGRFMMLDRPNGSATGDAQAGSGAPSLDDEIPF